MYKLEELADKIKHLEYVVLRNWEDLPNSLGTPGHEDLDLFVSEKDAGDLYDILSDFDDFEKVDVWKPSDKYLPEKLSIDMTKHVRMYNGFKIPEKLNSFLSLYYHASVHKEKNLYEDKLKRMFLEIYPAVKCIDDGVGHYV